MVNTLIKQDYLVPNNPGSSTVAAFYPVDEPELCGLKDQGGNPHPALANAVNTVINNPDTSNFPLAVITSSQYPSAIQGIRLFDWAGFDQYDKSTTKYLSNFTDFTNSLLSNQRTILVPQASFGGFMSGFGPWHDPDLILDRFLEDSRIIGIIPFLWAASGTDGTRDIPELKDAYTAIGLHIKSGVPLPPKVELSCSGGGGGIFDCTANTSRGVPPYSYQWHGAAMSSGNTATYSIQCGVFGFSASVTVTDSVQGQGEAEEPLYCEEGSHPQGVEEDA